ncbi:hypothetical protein BESB_055260 [Besnoitia besnoiti]|uniref:Uncharacterized protein n=1 Tax=Besnoitia besnoiti TaxID=94643 RepID=A0A2A9MD07_BESBE|nr:hypothetical protein BESB_055260 [Besnoitia besnoiti]PFH35875.1 hypothetical protein BESB_055260 [Besnoitia besnoiti]
MTSSPALLGRVRPRLVAGTALLILGVAQRACAYRVVQRADNRLEYETDGKRFVQNESTSFHHAPEVPPLETVEESTAFHLAEEPTHTDHEEEAMAAHQEDEDVGGGRYEDQAELVHADGDATDHGEEEAAAAHETEEARSDLKEEEAETDHEKEAAPSDHEEEQAETDHEDGATIPHAGAGKGLEGIEESGTERPSTALESGISPAGLPPVFCHNFQSDHANALQGLSIQTSGNGSG